MAENPEYTRKLREVFWVRDKEFATRAARLCVLYEDLRVEYFGSRHLGDLPPIDDLSRFYRQFYFLRRSLVTMDEFSSALHRMNELGAWHKHVQTKGDKELKKRWNSAVTFFAENKKRIATMRGHFGGHFPEQVAGEVIKKLTANQVGSIELDIDEEDQTAGVKLHFCTDLLSIVLRLHDDKEDPTDEELRANAREHSLFLGAAWKHAADAASVLILGYFLNRFRGKSGA